MIRIIYFIRHNLFLVLGLLFFAFGVGIRIANLFHTGFSFDTITTQYTWGSTALDWGFINFWRDYNDWFDYLPGAVYYLMGVVKISHILGTGPEVYIFVLKLLNFVFDGLFAGLIFYWARKSGITLAKTVFIAGLVFAAPSIWFVSGVWGQLDGVVVVLSIISLWLVDWAGRNWWWPRRSLVVGFAAGVILALSFWLKMQAVLIVPLVVLLVIFLRAWRIGALFLAGFVLTSLLIMAPALYANPIRLGGNLLVPFTRDNTMSRSASTFWTLVNTDTPRTTDSVIKLPIIDLVNYGNLALFLFVLVNVYAYLRIVGIDKSIWQRKRSLKEWLIALFPRGTNFFSLVMIGVFLSLTYFLFIPRMYERYLHPAIFLAFMAVVMAPSLKLRRILLLVTGVLSLGHFLNLIDVYNWWGYATPSWVGWLMGVLNFNERNVASLLFLVVLAILIKTDFWASKLGKVVGDSIRE